MDNSQNRRFASSWSDQDIDQAERQIGDIPDDLKTIFREKNGGVPELSSFKSDLEDEYTIDYIFPIPEERGEPAHQNIIKINTFFKKDGLVPESSLVFASDPGDNYFSVDRKTGAVWYHPMDVWENGRSPEDNQKDTMERIADSIDLFFSSLSDES